MAREFHSHLFESAAAVSPLASMPTTAVSTPRDDDIVIQNKISLLEQKIQKMALQISHLETSFKNQTQDLRQAQADLISKVNERKVTDLKIQELIDRHHNITSVFESRLAALQKVNAEQELKIMGYQSTLDEILREIKRRS